VFEIFHNSTFLIERERKKRRVWLCNGLVARCAPNTATFGWLVAEEGYAHPREKERDRFILFVENQRIRAFGSIP
jgi:hypothetical protein